MYNFIWEFGKVSLSLSPLPQNTILSYTPGASSSSEHPETTALCLDSSILLPYRLLSRTINFSVRAMLGIQKKWCVGRREEFSNREGRSVFD